MCFPRVSFVQLARKFHLLTILAFNLSNYINFTNYLIFIMDTTSDASKCITEGSAVLSVPKTVFYNHVQEFNRDLSVLILKTYLKYDLWKHKKEEKRILKRGGIRILDALSASGLRAIRYAKELEESINYVRKIIANDLSDSAVKLIRKNIIDNHVEDKVESSYSNAIAVINNSSLNFDDVFHVIDLDPFGSGSIFFDAAVRSIGNGGLLMVTCTDAAVLCGNSNETCFARYGSMSLKSRACHDMSLRIILKSLESHAATYGRYIKPLISLSIDFYVRLIVQVFESQGETKKSASKLSLVYQCKECETFEFNLLGVCKKVENKKPTKSENPNAQYEFKTASVVVADTCQFCGGKKNLGGPIWNGPIHDKGFLELLIKELDREESPSFFSTFKRMLGMIHMCYEELPTPLMFYLDDMSHCLKSGDVSYKIAASALLNAGYLVSQSHAGKGGIKTNAPNNVVWDIFCELAERNKGKIEPSDKKSLKVRLMTRSNRCTTTSFDFTYNKDCLTKSQLLDMVRFQRNPAPNWGPKARPSGCQNEDDQ